MDIEKINSDRHALLERLKDALLEELVACELREPENEGEPEVLRVVLDELGQDSEDGALGELFFLPPGSEEDEVQHFSAVLTITDDIDRSRLPELYEAMSHINYEIPCGSFCIDKEGENLVYRLTTPLPMAIEGDELFDQMNVCLANALISADMYMDILLKINDKEA
ncbi:MAG: hypothetical protein J6O71_05430 [Lachnospiraceae bacterium]|nr:hypothetical protein [Lachnospiraceae bacterium]